MFFLLPKIGRKKELTGTNILLEVRQKRKYLNILGI